MSYPAAEGVDVVSSGEGASRIVAHGVAGHAAEPAGAMNAIGVLASYLLGLGCLRPSEREFVSLCKRALCAWDGSGLGIEAQR